jgi:ribosomal protein S18 acetylase RimI-like enzyme
MDKLSLKKFNYSDFDNFFELMKEAFPSIERRNYEDQKELLNEVKYEIILNKDEKQSINAFLANWKFNNFYFVEHFAVANELRGHGLGSLMLKDYLIKSNKLIFLEVEPPEDKTSMRRIEFYERIGFYLNNFYYLQPPMQKQHDFLPLKVMSYPRAVNNLEFIEFKNTVYDKVYKFNG